MDLGCLRRAGIVRLLRAHVAGIVAFATVRGFGVVHGVQEATLVAVFALAATHRAWSVGPARPRPCSG